MKNKLLCLLLVVLTAFLSLSGCDDLNKKTATLQDNIEIPKNGIVSASVFDLLKEQNKVATFSGKSGGATYEWTVFGSDIKKVKSLNLGIKIKKITDKEVLLDFPSSDDFGFSPVLSISIGKHWDAKSATAYKSDGKTKESLCSVSVTGSKNTILNFSASSQKGSISIVADCDSPSDTSDESKASSNTESSVSNAHKPTESTESRILSDGTATEQDKYKTDPVPEGKPMPVEPDSKHVNTKKTYTCTFSIECSTILNNIKDLEKDKLDEVPPNGIILPRQTVKFYEGESVYDVLQRICKENGIQMEASWTPIYNSAYVEGIHNLYEFDCGSGSGWMYRVDGWYPNYGCSRYQLKQGETVEWRYTCDLGKDVGGGYAVGDK